MTASWNWVSADSGEPLTELRVPFHLTVDDLAALLAHACEHFGPDNPASLSATAIRALVVKELRSYGTSNLDTEPGDGHRAAIRRAYGEPPR